MESCVIVWYIDGSKMVYEHQRSQYIQRGYVFPSITPSIHVVTSQLSVTTSIGVNNTQHSCEVDMDSHKIMSNNATLLVISGKFFKIIWTSVLF